MIKSVFFFGLVVFGMGRASADQIQYLALPQQSLSAFATLIDQAETSIDLGTFIYQPCESSVRVLTDKLIAKAKSGVHVRVLLDDFMQPGAQKQNIANEFAKAGIELRTYSSALIDFNLRMHSKVLIVDRQRYIAGGRNFSDEYFALSSSTNYIDRDVLVSGDSVAEAAAGFERLWASDMASAPSASPDQFANWNSFCAADLGPAITQVRNYVQNHGPADLQSSPMRNCQTQYAVDDPDFYKAQYGPSWNHGKNAAAFLTEARLSKKHSTEAVLDFLRGTAQNLLIENQYCLPGGKFAETFERLRQRAIPISFLANRDGDLEVQIVIQAEEYEMAKLQIQENVGSESVSLMSSTGTTRTEFSLTPPGVPFFLHSKVAVRDHRDVLVGSFNIDERSANLNVETAVSIFNCPELVSDVENYDQRVYEELTNDIASGLIQPKVSNDPLIIPLGDAMFPEL